MLKILIDASAILNFKSGYGRYFKHLLLGFNKYKDDNLKIILLLNKNAKKIDFSLYDYEVMTVNLSQKFLLYRYQILKDLIEISKKVDIWHNITSAPPLRHIESRIVLTVHDLAYLCYPEAYTFPSLFYWKYIYPLGLKKADSIIAVSKNTKNDLVKYYNISEEKISVIYNAVFLEEDCTFNVPNLPIELPHKYILYVGAINPRKNIIRLIEAFYLLKTREKKMHKLLLVGSFLWNSIDLNRYLYRYNLVNDVVIINDIEDKHLPFIYRNADVFVYPSLYEGFGYPPLEAMLYKVPVISSKAPPMPEILGEAAIYFDPYDSEDLYKKMCYVLDNYNERYNFIDKGLKRASEFSLEIMIQKLIELYKSLS